MKDFLFNYLDTIIISSSVSTIILSTTIFIIKKFFSKKIDCHFNKKLEEYKNELNVINRQVEFDYQRKIQDFSLYTTKKHEKYIELHELLNIANGAIRGLMGLQHELTYEEFNKEDVEKMLFDLKVPSGKINEIFTIWDDNGKEKAIKVMKEYLQMFKIISAKDSLIEVNNFYLKSRLFFSNDLCNYFEKSHSNLNELFALSKESIKLPGSLGRNGSIKINELRDKVKKCMDQLEETMKNEISIGYYKL